MDAPNRKTARMGGWWIAWLVVCWLLVDYPFGFWLFILSAALHRTLQSAQEIRSGHIAARRVGEVS